MFCFFFENLGFFYCYHINRIIYNGIKRPICIQSPPNNSRNLYSPLTLYMQLQGYLKENPICSLDAVRHNHNYNSRSPIEVKASNFEEVIKRTMIHTLFVRSLVAAAKSIDLIF